MDAQGIGLQYQGAAIAGGERLAASNSQGLLEHGVSVVMHCARQLARYQVAVAVVSTVGERFE